MNLISVKQFLSQTWLGVLTVSAFTGLFWILKFNYATAGFLFLLVVLFQALQAGAVSSIFVSVYAAVCLDYFFVAPTLALGIADPIDVAAFVTYIVTACVVTYMASSVRKESKNTRKHRGDLRLLFSSASRLLALVPEEIDNKYLGVFLETFRLRAICVFDASTGTFQEEGTSLLGLRDLTLAAYRKGTNNDDQSTCISVRCLHVAGELTGAVGLEECRYSSTVVGAVAALVGSTRERIRNLDQAIKAGGEARGEALRSAILDAFAHEFKTPLTAIMAAAGSLGEVGPLTTDQNELAITIEEQSARLAKLTSRVLRAARLDREEIRLKLKRIDLNSALNEIVASRANSPEGGRVKLVTLPQPAIVLADGELLALGLVPVLDNALKYSQPDTPINVSALRSANEFEIRVSSHGNPIPEGERHRIFERFERGTAGQASPGSGLGLFITRKIMKAHGGDIALMESQDARNEVTFSVRLPIAAADPDYARAS